jgi:hypothetical protein
MKDSPIINKPHTAVKFLKVSELANRWGLSLAATYRCLDRDIPVLRIGGSLRVPLDKVEAFERAQLGAA